MHAAVYRRVPETKFANQINQRALVRRISQWFRSGDWLGRHSPFTSSRANSRFSQSPEPRGQVPTRGTLYLYATGVRAGTLSLEGMQQEDTRP
jgi:hypothetical protein